MAVEININLEAGTSEINDEGNKMLGVKEKKSKAKEKTPERNKELERLRNVAIQNTKAFVMQTVNYSTSNIGKWTGSNHNQQAVNNLMQGVDLGIMIRTNPGQAAISIATSVTTTLLNNAWEQKWEKRASSQNLSRLGYSDSGEVVGKKR